MQRACQNSQNIISQHINKFSTFTKCQKIRQYCKRIRQWPSSEQGSILLG